MEVTLETIIEGLTNHDEWVYRAIDVLADHSAVTMIDRRRFRDYKEAVRMYGQTLEPGPTQEARKLCLKYADALLTKATAPSFHFHGKTFVMTGKLASYTRPQLTVKLKELGAFVSTSVNRNTDVVVVGKRSGIKYQRAQQFGCTIWDEKELLKNLASPASKT